MKKTLGHLKVLFLGVPLLLLFSPLILCDDRENLKQFNNILNSMNSSINPCENFYGYACGNYGSYKADSEYQEVLTTIQGEFLKSVERMLNKKYPSAYDIDTRRQNFTDKLRLYVSSCKLKNRLKLLKYLDVVKPSELTDWPIVEEMNLNGRRSREPWTYEKYSVFSLLGQLVNYGLNNVLFKDTIVSVEGKDRLILKVPQPEELPEVEVMEILALTGLPSNVTDKYYRDIMETHLKWQNIYKQYPAEDGATDLSFRELYEANQDLAFFVRDIMKPHLYRDDDIILFNQPEYMEYLSTLKFQPEELEKLCSYLMIQFLRSLKDTTDPSYCMAGANARLHVALNYVYYQHYYMNEGGKINEEISKLFKMLYRHFLTLVDENRLNLNAQQLNEIKAKLFQMIANIGNLPESVDVSEINRYYQSLPLMDKFNYYQNELNVRKFARNENLKCLNNVACVPDVAGSPAYIKYLNLIMFPFASVRAPLFHTEYDPLMAVSLMGFAMGHELGHSIDLGSLDASDYPSFNGNSNAHPGIAAASECIRQHEPATSFIDERIADLVGVNVAYRAYSLEYGQQPSYSHLPWQQLFFLNLAQFFCGKADIVYVDHDADPDRLHLIAMNTEEFAQAFQCPRGSKMNPYRKCRYV